MSTALDELASAVHTSGRTLRRAVARGTIRARRPSPRRLELSAREEEYVRLHWPLLQRLIAVLRTRPNVRLAVVFGSVARGDHSAGSDLDLLVTQRRDDWRERALLAQNLERAVARRVQVVPLEHAPALLLAAVLRDGRVLVDRDGQWGELRGNERRIARDAQAETRRLEEEAWAVLDRSEELLR
jgi:predicted nucleotidyltransferase